MRGRSLREAPREGGAFGQGNNRNEAIPSPARGGGSGRGRPPLTIEGELVARSTGAASPFARGDRVFHQKFGNGEVLAVDGNKLTIQFDKAGEKRVVDSFVTRV